MKKQKAFTLVELLVAMAIIGVLLGLAIFGLAAAQRAQRDTERKAALQDINIGMQTFYETNQKYPKNYVIQNVNQISFCSNANCTGTEKVNVPLKGAATASGTGPSAVNANLNTAQPDAVSTNYCLATSDQVTAVGGNPGGYVFCAKLENLSVFCVGAGAARNNIVTNCGNYTIQ